MQSEPPRLTVAQALVILVLLLVGMFWLRGGLQLLLLVAVMGVAAALLNMLFHWILRVTAPKPAPTENEDVPHE